MSFLNRSTNFGATLGYNSITIVPKSAVSITATSASGIGLTPIFTLASAALGLLAASKSFTAIFLLAQPTNPSCAISEKTRTTLLFDLLLCLDTRIGHAANIVIFSPSYGLPGRLKQS